MNGSHTGSVLLRSYENVINMLNLQTKLVRLVTDNAANNLKAFENFLILGFEHYFDHENIDENEAGSDADLDVFNDEDDNENSFTQVIHNNDDMNVIESTKQSFDNIAIHRDFLRIRCFAHTLQLMVNDRLKVP